MKILFFKGTGKSKAISLLDLCKALIVILGINPFVEIFLFKIAALHATNISYIKFRGQCFE